MVKKTAKEINDEIRAKVNEKRQDVLDLHRPDTPEYEIRLSEAFRPKWYKFTKEIGYRVFKKKGWGGRYFYVRLAGTGQVIAAGGAFSFGPSWGATVITLPALEITLGYIR